MESYICSVKSFDLYAVLGVPANVLLHIVSNFLHIRQFPEAYNRQTIFNRSNKHNARWESDRENGNQKWEFLTGRVG
jgi:hypothetical protein